MRSLPPFPVIWLVLLACIPQSVFAGEDKQRGYFFVLLVEGKEMARFTECSGLGVKFSEMWYEAGANIEKFPEPVEYGDVTLHYGKARNRALWNWAMDIERGILTRKKVIIRLLDKKGKKVAMEWTLEEAWPSGWEGDMSGAREQIHLESVTVTFEALKRGQSE